jgi:Uma2 family endonuclease
MTSIEQLIQPLLHSPQLPLVVARLQRELESENIRRQQFYAAMTPEQKVEFIDGQVVTHSPARNRHLDVTLRVCHLLRTFVAVHALGQVKHEKCLCVFPRNDYEPDVVFFGFEKSARLQDDTMHFPIPDLIVEVLSDSTAGRDRGLKFEDYAANGVSEYWIIDADVPFIEQYCLEQGQYQLQLKSSTGQLVSRVIPGLEFPVVALFDPQTNLQVIRHWLSS